MRERADEKLKWLSRCGTSVLNTEWDFPSAGRSDLKKKTEYND